MGYLTIGEDNVSDMSNAELLETLQATKGGYQLREKTARIWLAIIRSIDSQGPPMTVRGIFYNCENVYHVVGKTEAGYNQVANQVLAMRRAGALPYSFVADHTRWMRRPETYSGLRAYFEHGVKAYRRALWDDSPDYVEVWCEKDAIAGIVDDITDPWDVPLMVVRGFSSETFAYSAAENIKAQGKPAWIYYFGDWDKHGVNISRDIERKLREFGARVNFERVAVLPWQIEAYDLPTRPAKDKDWGDAVEIDAIPANLLREMVRETIERHINRDEYDRLMQIEAQERQTLETVIENMGLA